MRHILNRLHVELACGQLLVIHFRSNGKFARRYSLHMRQKPDMRFSIRGPPTDMHPAYVVYVTCDTITSAPTHLRYARGHDALFVGTHLWWWSSHAIVTFSFYRPLAILIPPRCVQAYSRIRGLYNYSVSAPFRASAWGRIPPYNIHDRPGPLVVAVIGNISDY